MSARGGRPEWPILEFDPERSALIEPAMVVRRRPDVPRAAVVCFFAEVVEEVCGEGRAELLVTLGMESPCRLYSLDVGRDRRIAVVHAGIGAPMVSAIVEELIALGCRAFVACGGAGAVVPDLALGHVVVPDRAVRDEGTSYHYLPAGREIEADPADVAVAVGVLERNGVPHTVAKTWSTDAPFRETAGRVARRREEGCVTVEMETAALLAVARHRGVRFAQYLYAGDDLSGETWEHRSWQRWSSRRALFDLAVEAALEL